MRCRQSSRGGPIVALMARGMDRARWCVVCLVLLLLGSYNLAGVREHMETRDARWDSLAGWLESDRPHEPVLFELRDDLYPICGMDPSLAGRFYFHDFSDGARGLAISPGEGRTRCSQKSPTALRLAATSHSRRPPPAGKDLLRGVSVGPAAGKSSSFRGSTCGASARGCSSCHRSPQARSLRACRCRRMHLLELNWPVPRPASRRLIGSHAKRLRRMP